jgi:nucleoside-diphosphate kinase
MIKPDGVQRGLMSEIIGRFETKGFTLVGMKFMTVPRELAEQHYAVHRKMIGATKPIEAEPGTIRGDLGVTVGRNIIHGSDAPDTAEVEIALWFTEAELVNWTPNAQPWLYE